MTAANETVRQTPLNAAHRAAGAKMVPFAGWEMPLHYGSALEEHKATRAGCGLFDVSHMGQVMVTGRDAGALVQAIVSRNVARLADGQQAYAVLCDEDGRLVDDLIAARIAADRWLIVVNAATREGDVAVMRGVRQRLGLPNADLEDQSDRWAMIAVQGPQWKDAVRGAIGAGDWEGLRPYRIAEGSFGGRPMLFSTTGYTGERGVELLCASEAAEDLWNKLVAAGGRPVGLAARDSLRLEMGYCLSGQDFTSDNDPFEAGLGWVVDLDTTDFNGAAALRRLQADPPERRLVGLVGEGKRIPRHGARVVEGDAEIGVVTSGGWSPGLEAPIALAYVASDKAEAGTHVEVELSPGKTVGAKVTKPPFIGNKR